LATNDTSDVASSANALLLVNGIKLPTDPAPTGVAVNDSSKELAKASTTTTAQDPTARDSMSSSPSTATADVLMDAVSTATASSSAGAEANSAMIAAGRLNTAAVPSHNIDFDWVFTTPTDVATTVSSTATVNALATTPICDPTARDTKASEDAPNVPSTGPEYKPKLSPASATPQDGSNTVTPSGSEVSTADSTVGKPGFQPASKAPLVMHMQARDASLPTTAKAKAKPSQSGIGPDSEGFTVPSSSFDSYDSTAASSVNRNVPAFNSFEASTDICCRSIGCYRWSLPYSC